MRIYYVNSGMLKHNGERVAGGYSGAPEYKNNSQYECLKDRGPLPRGTYTITAPFRHPHAGPFTLRLVPAAANHMCDREGFMIHGDSTTEPGQASQGCIILPLQIRKKIWDSNDRDLRVE